METNKPIRRGDCRGKERPCVFISCKHHMIWAFATGKGFLGKINNNQRVENFLRKNTDDEIIDMIFGMKETCTLDVATCRSTLEKIGNLLGVSRERVRQIEDCKRGGAIQKLRRPARKKFLKDFVDHIEFDPGCVHEFNPSSNGLRREGING